MSFVIHGMVTSTWSGCVHAVCQNLPCLVEIELGNEYVADLLPENAHHYRRGYYIHHCDCHFHPYQQAEMKILMTLMTTRKVVMIAKRSLLVMITKK